MNNINVSIAPIASIREGIINDLDCILAINATQEHRWDEMKFTEVFHYELPVWVIVNTDEAIIGYIISGIFLDEIRVLNLCISSAYQGNGYGEQLMRHALTQAQEVNWSTLNVRVNNHKAIKLYLKLGYKILCRRESYYDDFAYTSSFFMQLDLRHKIKM